MSAELSASDALSVIRGARLFHRETFDGNGRTCATCHLPFGETRAFDLTPADVERAYLEDSSGPLFRAVDSDDGTGASYSLLRRDATIRVPFTLPANVTVDELESPNVRVGPDGRITVFVRRSVPSAEGTLFADALMWDGRAGADPESQALDAIRTHAQPLRLPTARELADIARYEAELLGPRALVRLARTGRAPTLPAGRTPEERRGREFFVDHGPVDATHRGLCATCHGGPLLDTTTIGNPLQPPGQRFSNNFVSETNGTLGHSAPELTYRFTLTRDLVMPQGLPLPIPPGTPLLQAGTVLTLRSADPGRLLVTGDPCELPAACIVNPGSSISVFRISSLWGVAGTAPYFHDHSARDLEEVMDLYQLLFAFTADALGNPAFVISDGDRRDILAYMRFAFAR